MKKLNAALVTVLSLVIISGVMFNTVSFASSINSNTHTNKISNDIPKSVLKNARIFAETTVLGKTDAELHSILTTHGLLQVLSQEGLTPKTFREDVRTEITSYLTEKGFTQTQILSALNSRYIKSHKNNI
ncbi:MAG TPA: hypothetical protein VMQ58_01045 [Candidatus Saccharimonadales bacterium]|nr:hypothetical protein [Candidatus Saccharimonadales bacterium]